jgi:hypothetical protein
MIGLSLFFLAGLLLFILVLDTIIKDKKDLLKSQVFKLLLIFLFCAFGCFAYAFLVPVGSGSDYLFGAWSRLMMGQ